MRVDQYTYAKDTRSDEDYKRQVENGIHNQKIVMESYVAEKLHIDGEDGWNFIENPDKEFSTEWGEYRPDYLLVTPHAKAPVPCEVKTQLTPLGEAIYVKKNQIDKLVSMNGMVLYATPDKYFMMTALLWQTMEPSEKFSKPAYKIYTEDAPWRQWKYRLETLRGY